MKKAGSFVWKTVCKFPVRLFTREFRLIQARKTGFGIYGKTLYFFWHLKARKPLPRKGLRGRHLF